MKTDRERLVCKQQVLWKPGITFGSAVNMLRGWWQPVSVRAEGVSVGPTLPQGVLGEAGASNCLSPKMFFIFLWQFTVCPGREFCIQNHFIPGLPKYSVLFSSVEGIWNLKDVFLYLLIFFCGCSMKFSPLVWILDKGNLLNRFLFYFPVSVCS